MPAGVALTPEVKLGGSALAGEWMDSLMEIRCEAEYGVPARATLRFLEHDGVAGQSPLVGESAVKLGTPVEISSSDATGSTVQLFKGEITAVAVNISSGSADLVLTAHDKSHRLNRTTAVKAFNSVKLSDLVSQLATSAGLTADASSTDVVFDWILQPDTAMGMLCEMARRTGFDWWVDDTTLKFQKPAEGTVIEVQMFQDVTALSVRANGHHPDTVQVQGWDNTQKQEIVGTSSSPSSSVLGTSDLAVLATGTQSAYGAGTRISGVISTTTVDEATQVSQALLDRAASAAVSVRGTCVDVPTIALGTTLDVQGVGYKLAGKYPVTKVEHVFRAGTPLTTRFSAGDRTSSSLVETLSGTGARSSGFRKDGLVIGLVTNGQDDNNLGRVKVKFPGLSGEMETWWARVINVGAGSNRGGGYQPEVNDEVLVGFENADPRRPVVLGGLFNSKDSPPTLKYSSAKALEERTITSRKGHKMSIVEGDDNPDDAAILLALAESKGQLNLAASGATLELPAEKPITIKAGTSSIVISSSGDITLDGGPSGNITIKTTGGNVSIQGVEVKISAQTNLELAGQVQSKLTGTMVNVEANGVTAVKGAMVQIN